jgi:hypothetical protein
MARIANCTMCLNDFISTRLGHIYCSIRCRQRANDAAPSAKPTHRITPEVAAFVRQPRA